MSALLIMNRTFSLAFSYSMRISGWFFEKTRKISSQKAWPARSIPLKSRTISLNLSRPWRILRAWERETKNSSALYSSTVIWVLSKASSVEYCLKISVRSFFEGRFNLNMIVVPFL